jgi:hypothetical protein
MPVLCAVPENHHFSVKMAHSAPKTHGAVHQNNIHVGECGGSSGFLPKRCNVSLRSRRCDTTKLPQNRTKTQQLTPC